MTADERVAEWTAPLDNMPPIDREHVDNVCRIGQGARCCSFLVMGSNGFECAKDNKRVLASILVRRESMGSQGDNCPGWLTHSNTASRSNEETDAG